MAGVSTITICKVKLNRIMRQAIAVLVAYGMASNLILVAFAVSVMAAGMPAHGDSLLVGSPSTQSLIRVLCRPGALWTDVDDSDSPEKTESVHLRDCCGTCALQNVGAWDVPTDFKALVPHRHSTDIQWRLRRTVHASIHRIIPTARGPPHSLFS